MYTYSRLSDEQLTSLLKTRDHAAFTEIYNRYMGLLYLHAYKILMDEDETEDILHEIFTSLWIKAPELVLKDNLAAYLYRAIKNRVLNALAHRKIKQSYLESLEDFLTKGSWSTEETVREQELASIIKKEVTHLPRKMREVFQLSRIYHKSHKEIADQLGISDKTVKKQINNAIKILRLKIRFLIVFMPL
ncbi:RNA polymerase subunit sigma-70 [Pedobacter sp. KBW06]|uniref:RNA polymerase sigma factor n=1 Tax=Pedobacter sp. KBW06 TaxID=2153359 RepID=UPI000F5A671C|nr:RNA polymerase sigma-70 factor [Pedobacter sp. KBW06]RQO75632.1 RNA polymerase subunit sigma-70 [Pedobacter sp. KBW06]